MYFYVIGVRCYHAFSVFEILSNLNDYTKIIVLWAVFFLKSSAHVTQIRVRRPQLGSHVFILFCRSLATPTSHSVQILPVNNCGFIDEQIRPRELLHLMWAFLILGYNILCRCWFLYLCWKFFCWFEYLVSNTVDYLVVFLWLDFTCFSYTWISYVFVSQVLGWVHYLIWFCRCKFAIYFGVQLW